MDESQLDVIPPRWTNSVKKPFTTIPWTYQLLPNGGRIRQSHSIQAIRETLYT